MPSPSGSIVESISIYNLAMILFSPIARDLESTLIYFDFFVIRRKLLALLFWVSLLLKIFGLEARAEISMPQSILLNSNWTLRSSANFSGTGEQVSTSDYNNQSDWMKAVVPGTVLNSYVQAGIYPEPYYGINNKLYPDDPSKNKIPDAQTVGSSFAVSHWFRTSFSPPNSFKGKTVWLKFEGINWRANIYVNGHAIGSMIGAYQRGIFDITKWIQPGVNGLAVKIDPLSSPGVQGHEGCGGNRQIGLTPATIYQTMTWDFNYPDGVRDRNMGIIRDVELYATGAVDIRDPFMSTDGVPGERGNLEFKTFLINSTTKEQSGNLVLHFNDRDVSKPVILRPMETREIAMSYRDFPGLTVQHPKLWWPAGRGDQALYPLKVTFNNSSNETTELDTSFGIRSIENKPEKGQYVFWINGKKMFLSGGNWVQDALQRQTPEREEAQIRMIRQAGLNWIRFWSGSGPQDEALLNLCDKYGILTWAESGLCDQLDIPRNDSFFCQTVLANWGDYVYRLRPHPSLFNYVGTNEGPDIAHMSDVAMQNDGTRPYAPSSQDFGQRGSPYRWLGINGLYDYTSTDLYGAGKMGLFGGFCDESGNPCLPTAETIREQIPADKVFPIDKEYADYQDGGGFHQMYKFITEGCAEYGNLNQPDMTGRSGVENYAFKGQLIDAMEYRADGELWQRNKWDENGRFSTGYALWTVNNTHPQLCSRLFSYNLEPNASLYYMAHANKALHVQFDYFQNDLSAVNNSFMPASHLKVRAEVRNLDWSLQWSQEKGLASLPAETTKTKLLSIPTKNDVKFSDVHFVRVQLLDGNGVVLDDEIYWRSKADPKYGADGPFTALNQMPESQLKVASSTAVQDGKLIVTVKLTNATRELAFFTRLKVLDPSNQALVRPCFFSDNYFSVMPGETKVVTIECPVSGPAKPTVGVEGWNFGALRLASESEDVTPPLSK